MPRPSFEELVRALSEPAAFPNSPATVECAQTHISAAFLSDNLVYKIKKPKKLLFLDFTSLELRRHFCHEEVRLNRRLAPAVYQGVVPILWEEGKVRVSEHVVESATEDPGGEVLEWAVRMVRLPEEQTLGALLDTELIGAKEVARLARWIAEFHSGVERGSRISSVASWETTRRNGLENFEQIEALTGRTITAPVFARLRALITRELDVRRTVMEERVQDGIPREIHGDLRAEHVYLLPSGSPGSTHQPNCDLDNSEGELEFVIIDCIEFNERFRLADPVADIAFLVMELEFLERFDLAAALARHYFIAANDPEGTELLSYYATYRDIVRGKVRSLQSVDELVGRGAREEAAAKASRHFMRALTRLSLPSERPALVVVQGLPGVGKSTVARGLARTAGFHWVDTDRVRKDLAASEGIHDRTSGADRSAYLGGIYSQEWTEKTYLECVRRARERLLDGGRVVLEGSFRRDAQRIAILEVARGLGVEIVFLNCHVDRNEVHRRLDSRPSGHSDADWRIYLRMADEWETASTWTAPYVREIALGEGPEEAVAGAREILVEEGLA